MTVLDNCTRQYGPVSTHTNKTEDKSASDQTAGRLYLTSQGGNQTPSDDEETNVPTGSAGVVEHQVRRHLHQDISDEKDGKTQVVFGWGEFEVFGKTLKFGSGVVISEICQSQASFF